MTKYRMMIRLTIALLASLAFTGPVASAQVAATPAPSATPNGPVLARAIDWYHRLQTGQIDRSQLSAKLDQELTPATVAAVQNRLASLGDPVSFVQKQTIERSGATMYVYDLKYKEGGEMQFQFTFLNAGPNATIVGLYLTAPVQ